MSTQDTSKGISPADLAAILAAFGPVAQTSLRWGISVEPTWIHAAEIVAPLAGAVLVTQAVTAGKQGYIFGLLITSTETNNFRLNWTSGGAAKSKLIVFGGGGSMESIDQIAMNKGLLADPGSNITITNVNAGAAGQIYQANLLYAEL